ncbi:hypothetical protein CAC42_6691 [Sphaceloma murrayae]|uniref:Uncharacterized protein n=1 Tax=Sphaceloma murrayae TaxID=2082308 RepID=A0A2K1QG75_9PEZI|nr:hypothetical protein CAC42_6691 [Sphaceloma murrayae]
MASLMLTRFSFGESVDVFKSSEFTHISDGSLCLMVEQDPETTFTVIRRTETLSSIPIGRLIRLSLDEKQHSQATSYTREDLSVYIVFRNLQIACQYRLPQEKPLKRRVQITFQSTSDCIKVVQHLIALGIEYDDKNDKPAPRPNTSPAVLSDAITKTAQSPCQFNLPSGPSSVVEGPSPSTHSNLFSRSSYTTSPTPGFLTNMLPMKRTVSPLDGSSIATTSETMAPPKRRLPEGFPPRSSGSEASPHFVDPPAKLASSTSRRVTRSGSKPKDTARCNAGINKSTTNATSAPRGKPNVLTAPASDLGKRTLNLDENTTLLPQAEPIFSVGNFQTHPLHHQNVGPGTTTPPFTTINPSSLPDQVSDFGRVLAEITNDSGREQQRQLADYAAQTEQQRGEALNRFVVDNLRNDDFLQLCRDMEGCWRLLGLGLGL